MSGITAIQRIKAVKKPKKECNVPLNLTNRPLLANSNSLKSNVGTRFHGQAMQHAGYTTRAMTQQRINKQMMTNAHELFDREKEVNAGAGITGSMFFQKKKGLGRDNSAIRGIRFSAHANSAPAVKHKAYGGVLSKTQIAALQHNTVYRHGLVKNKYKGDIIKNTRAVAGRREGTQRLADGIPFNAVTYSANSLLGSGLVNDTRLQGAVSTQESYSHLGMHNTQESYQNIPKNSIKEGYIRIGAESGQATSNKFEKYQPQQLSGQITEHMKITGNSGKQHVPIYEQYRQTKQLDPKIKTEGVSGKSHLPKYEKYHNMKRLNNPTLTAKNVTSSKSTSLNNASVKAEHFVRLSPNKPIASTAPQNRIEAVINPNKDNFKIRHKKPDVSQFSANSMARIPQF